MIIIDPIVAKISMNVDFYIWDYIIEFKSSIHVLWDCLFYTSVRFIEAKGQY